MTNGQRNKQDQLLQLYLAAKEVSRGAGYENEARWQSERDPSCFDERDFLRESAWVVLCAGFREAIVRRKFSNISLCFCDWDSAAEIVRYRALCRSTALGVFAHTKKIDAILETSELVLHEGFTRIREGILRDRDAYLRRFPYVGPVTACHLAKNLGLPFAKNDKHLLRLSLSFGFRDAHELCSSIADLTGESIAVVDIVLWRYCVLQRKRYPKPPRRRHDA